MSNLKARINNVLRSYSNGSSALVALIPAMLHHIDEHGDYSSTVERVLNGVEKKDAARIRVIILACVAEKSLSMTWDKDSNKYKVDWGKNKRGGFYLNDNSIGVLESLVGEGVRLHSPKIDEALLERKDPPAFDLVKRAESLVKKAFGEHATPQQIMAAINAAMLKNVDKAPAVEGYSAPAEPDPVTIDDVEDAITLRAVSA